MPLYEYECDKCKRRIVTLQRMSDPDYTSHTEIPDNEKCDGNVKKVYSVFDMKFVGGGFYKNDYKDK